MTGKKKKLPQNEFNLIGRVGYIAIKYDENSTKAKTTISLGVKKYNGYDNFFIMFTDTEKSNTAERAIQNIKVGDYIRATGNLSSYEKEIYVNLQGERKKIPMTSLTGWGFKHVKFDAELKGYVDIETEPEKPKTNEPILKMSDEDFSDNLLNEEDIPF